MRNKNKEVISLEMQLKKDKLERRKGKQSHIFNLYRWTGLQKTNK